MMIIHCVVTRVRGIGGGDRVEQRRRRVGQIPPTRRGVPTGRFALTFVQCMCNGRDVRQSTAAAGRVRRKFTALAVHGSTESVVRRSTRFIDLHADVNRCNVEIRGRTTSRCAVENFEVGLVRSASTGALTYRDVIGAERFFKVQLTRRYHLLLFVGGVRIQFMGLLQV
jgi:hypothetical protein